MDDTDAAKAVLRRHQPSRWLARLGISRCRQGCGRWPCNLWHNARDQRDRVLDGPAIARMLAIVNELKPRQVHDANR